MPNDNPPTTPADNNDTAFNAYDDMVALKRVTSTDITHAVVRRDWVSEQLMMNTHTIIHRQILQTQEQQVYSAATFYVLTDDYNVYKVINNDNTASTVKPDQYFNWLYHDCRCYVWKYMYTISAADALKFLSTDFMPVRRITSDPGK